jgi:ADP-ribose pyrophosphatase YjhB (NUDIX family)
VFCTCLSVLFAATDYLLPVFAVFGSYLHRKQNVRFYRFYILLNEEKGSLMQEGKFFNIRVYGILLNDAQEILVAEEFHYDTFMRKFPGGGLQFGEGIKDALMREIKEELDEEVEGCAHFYTTDFFVQSAFNENHQVVAVYYLVKTTKSMLEKYRDGIGSATRNGDEYFRWLPLRDIRPEDFTFPVDQQAVKLILEKIASSTLKMF